MIFSFVNWFWKKRNTVNFDWSWNKNLTRATIDFQEQQRELDERLAAFENKLSSEQYQEYMNLRLTTQKVNFAWNRVETLQGVISDHLKSSSTNKD